MSLESRYKDLLVDIINKKFPQCHIWLFGSRARKSNKSGADIDLAIDAGHDLTLRELSDIKDAFEESDVPVFVDIVDIRNVAHDFLNQIKEEWIPWQ